jgi:hypothetical protein
MTAVEQAVETIKCGNLERLVQLLADDPALAEARSDQGASLIMVACYHRQPKLAAALASRRALDVFEAAALGDAVRLAELCDEQPQTCRRSCK